MLLSWTFLIAGLALLYAGAQTLIRGGAALALRLGLTPLVIGLTVVAYGTSSPELVVSLDAAASGNGAISLGNVVGSNICNIALILGACSLIRPVEASSQVVRREIPLMLAATFALALFLLDRRLDRWEGALLFAGILAYTWTTIRGAVAATRAAAQGPVDPLPAEIEEEIAPAKSTRLGTAIALTTIGLGILVGGSHLFVRGAVELAAGWGISQTVIGLTIVAIGTSMPELATSLVAAFRRHSDVAVGNIVGSNTFNILGILGICSLITPVAAPGLSLVDLAMMLGVSLLLLPVARSGGRVSRWEGASLLAIYAAYTAWLISQAS